MAMTHRPAGQEATGGALRQLRCATAMAPRTEVSPCGQHDRNTLNARSVLGEPL
jgi:hypothetical protein